MTTEVRVVAKDDKDKSNHFLTQERLRTIVQDSHLNFLVGAGTPSSFIHMLGDIEDALTRVSESAAPEQDRAFARASLQGHFFNAALAPNLKIIEPDKSATDLLTTYAYFLRTLNRILLKRRNSLLSKQVNIFTTNVDMVFEAALELIGLDYSDGFGGKIHPRFDLGEFNTLRFRQGTRYEHRSEIPVVSLYKIHGSVGWRQDVTPESPSTIYFDHGLTLLREVADRYAKAKATLLAIPMIADGDGKPTDRIDVDSLLTSVKGQTLSKVGQAFIASYSRLGIVNPDKEKFATTVLNETHYELIRRLTNELEKENSVLFVHGFSFRDEHIRSLLLRSARSNPTLQIIVFCYSRKDRSAYEVLLPDELVKNGNISYVVPEDPREDQIDEERLDLAKLDRSYFAPLIADKIPTPDSIIELDIRADSGAAFDA